MNDTGCSEGIISTQTVVLDVSIYISEGNKIHKRPFSFLYHR
jgi:hypothetical protein